MVTYLLIIIATILLLTYTAYKYFPLGPYGVSPKILALCGLTAFLLGLLATQILVYINNGGIFLGVLLITLLFSSSVLVLTNDVSAEETVNSQTIIYPLNHLSEFIPNVETTIHNEGLVATVTKQFDTVLEADMDEIRKRYCYCS